MSARRDKDDRGLGDEGPQARGSRNSSARAGSRSESRSESFSPALDRLLLQAIDPYWAQAAWSVDPRSVQARRERLGDPSAVLVLRFHAFLPPDAVALWGPAQFDVEVPGLEGNYYANFWRGGHHVEAELGLRASSGDFLPIVRSNRIELPPDGESPRYEVRWRRVLGAPSALWKARFADRGRWHPAPDEAVGGLDSELAREIAAPVSEAPSSPPAPPGRWEPVLHAACEVSEPVARVPPPSEALEAQPEAAFQRGTPSPTPAAAPAEPLSEAAPPPAPVPPPAPSRSLRPQISEAPSSAEVSSFRKPVREERPYLEVRADIVIYGVARPGSELVIEGVKVPVRTDGTFDVRFSLPPSQLPSEGDASGGDAGRGGAP